MRFYIFVVCILMVGCVELEQRASIEGDDDLSINPVNLRWTTPNRMEDEGLLDGDMIAAYYVQWGDSEENLDNIKEVPWNENSYTVTGLSTGIYYFSVSVETTLGERSALSNIVSKEIF